MTNGAVIVIGRNEGERLRVSIASAVGLGAPVIYVDSGSKDGSPELARSLGCEVVALDPSRPFSAARARNEGFEAAARRRPAPEWIQFLDGDCELASQWLDRGASELAGDPKEGIVAGRLREQNPEASIYNRLCQMEWEEFPGRLAECGGNMLVRAEAFRQVNGFDASIPAGEELDFCHRIKSAGWSIRNVGQDMATHDADLSSFGQWWTRTSRGGQAYARAAFLHGWRYAWRPNASIFLWGLALPLVSIGAAWPTSGISLLLLLAYPLQAARIAFRRIRRGTRPGDACLYAVFTLVGKFAQVVGQFRFLASGKVKAESAVPVDRKPEAPENPEKPAGSAEPGPKR